MHARMRHLAVAALLVALALAIYRPVAGFSLVNYDDDVYLEAPQLAQGLSADSVRWAFTESYREHWHPITWLSWLTEIHFFGPNAGMLHLDNALLHAANGVLVYAALFLLTRKSLPSALTAALFVVHPMHVESVAWISERKDVLSVFFGLWTLVAYARYARAPGVVSGIGVAFAFTLSLLSKSMLVTLPFVLLLLDWWPLGRVAVVGWSRLVLEKLPLVALAAADSAITWVVQSGAGATRPLPLGERLANVSTAYVGYLEKTVAPVGLAVIYPRPVHGPEWGPSALAAVALALVSWAAWSWRRRLPYVAVGWAWFVGTLLPVIGIVPIGELSMADRYSYFPHIGLFLALAFWLDEFVFESRARSLRIAAASACAATLVALAWLAHAQTLVWKDSETLWRHALDVTRDNYVAHANLGRALQATHPAEAQAHFGAALAINPDAFRPVASPNELPGAR